MGPEKRSPQILNTPLSPKDQLAFSEDIQAAMAFPGAQALSSRIIP
jgi:hypothetical protein